jgi:hypothetical protein
LHPSTVVFAIPTADPSEGPAVVAQVVDVGEVIGAGEFTTNVIVGVVAVPLGLVAVTAKLEAPGTVGTPERTPVAGSKWSPAGRVPLVTE